MVHYAVINTDKALCMPTALSFKFTTYFGVEDAALMYSHQMLIRLASFRPMSLLHHKPTSRKWVE